MIPESELLRSAEARVRLFRKEFGIHTAPVDCFRLVQEMEQSAKFPITWQSTNLVSASLDAQVVYFPEIRSFLIVSRTPPADWKRHSAWRRCNFTMAHELGHIFCGHLKIPNAAKSHATVRLEDREADAFAACLLMPPEAMGLFRTAAEAADALWVSESAVHRRMAELGLRFGKKRCPNCRNTRMGAGAKYCGICGWMMIPGPNSGEEPEVAYLPPVPRICPVCAGKRWVNKEGECPDCGYPRLNYCMPEYNQPQHYARADELFCERCGAETLFKEAKNRPFQLGTPT